jgi:hypothetical protein
MKVVLGRVRDTADRPLKVHSYDRIAEGKAIIDRLPPGIETGDGERPWGKIAVFEAAHPLKGWAPDRPEGGRTSS